MPARAAGLPAPWLFAVVCAAYSVFHLFTAATGPFTPLTQRGVFIGVAVLLGLWSAADIGARRGASVVLLVLAVIGLASGLYAAWNEPRFMDVMNDMTHWDMAAAGLLLVAVLVATQRQLGWSLPVMSVIGLVYYVFGNGFITGTWQPPRISVDTLVSTMYGSTNGMFGFMADIGTSVIAIYVIYGALLMATGAGEVFVQVATRIAGHGHGGPAKVAVVTSALFGTVSTTLGTMNTAPSVSAFSCE